MTIILIFKNYNKGSKGLKAILATQIGPVEVFTFFMLSYTSSQVLSKSFHQCGLLSPVHRMKSGSGSTCFRYLMAERTSFLGASHLKPEAGRV